MLTHWEYWSKNNQGAKEFVQEKSRDEMTFVNLMNTFKISLSKLTWVIEWIGITPKPCRWRHPWGKKGAHSSTRVRYILCNSIPVRVRVRVSLRRYIVRKTTWRAYWHKVYTPQVNWSAGMLCAVKRSEPVISGVFGNPRANQYPVVARFNQKQF